MRYVYVDLGAYVGDTYLHFMSNTKLPAPAQDFEVYLVEPSPNLKQILNALANTFKNIKAYIRAAAWIEDGHKTFGVDENLHALGSTLMESKANWDNFKKVEVRTFDLSDWIKQFKDDYLIVKMDIEGAEFPVLNKMLDDGTIKYIDELWCEFHPNKVRDYTTTDKEKLIERINDAGVRLTEWH